jgi:hypothetical protein
MKFGIISTTNTLLGFVVVESVFGSDVAPENFITKVQVTGSPET